MIFAEALISLFDACLCIYFITKFNHKSISPKKNCFAIPAMLVIFAFSVINDLYLTGFNVLGTVIFLSLYIGYALLIASKKYIRAIVSACVFEIVYILLSSLLYLIISTMIKDYAQLMQGYGGIFRYIYILTHKITLFVILKIILMVFKLDNTIERKQGIIAFFFSFITILGLGSTMYIASESTLKDIQIQAIIIAFSFAFSNLSLYFLVYQIQKYQQNKYEIKLLQDKINFEEARHNDINNIWSNIKKIQHDIKQHLTIISGYIEDNKIAKCQEYIQELLPNIDSIGKLITSKNTVLDYIINSKLTPLDDTEIVISGSIGDLSDIKESDLVCLFGNILDNAVEAIQSLNRTTNKRIELLFMKQNSNRIIICKNTIEKSVLENNKDLKTTKKPKASHGYGTKIIGKIVSDYNGMVDYFEEFGMFGIQIIIPEPPKKCQ